MSERDSVWNLSVCPLCKALEARAALCADCPTPTLSPSTMSTVPAAVSENRRDRREPAGTKPSSQAPMPPAPSESSAAAVNSVKCEGS